MPTVTPDETLHALMRVGHATPHLDVLLLFGSRARGDAGQDSDWDLGYLAGPDVDVATLLGAIVEAVGSDRVDLVDLSRAGGLLRFRAARDGQLLFESRPRLAEQFRLDAATFWCDAAPVLERSYGELLDRLPR